jgi:hypothetical protein
MSEWFPVGSSRKGFHPDKTMAWRVPRRNSDETDIGSIDFKQMMKTPIGKWFFAPALMALLAMAAWGLVLTTMQLQNGLPMWVYSAPALPTVAIYYTIQLRKVWHVDIKPTLNIQTATKGIGKQTVKGNGIAPNIQGDNNVIHQTIIQNHPTPATTTATAPQPAPTPPPSPPVAASASSSVIPQPVVELRARDDDPKPAANDEEVQEKGPEILHAASVKVQAGSHEVIPLDLQKGDVVKGAILSDSSVYAFILTERTYGIYWKTRETGAARVLCDDDLSAQFRWTAPRAGRFYFVLDTYNKQTTRNVWVQLELAAKVAATA